jgi:hypothetical protein
MLPESVAKKLVLGGEGVAIIVRLPKQLYYIGRLERKIASVI